MNPQPQDISISKVSKMFDSSLSQAPKLHNMPTVKKIKKGEEFRRFRFGFLGSCTAAVLSQWCLFQPCRLWLCSHTCTTASTSWVERSRVNERTVSFQLSLPCQAVYGVCFKWQISFPPVSSPGASSALSHPSSPGSPLIVCILGSMVVCWPQLGTLIFLFHISEGDYAMVNHLAFLCVYIFLPNQIELFIFFWEPLPQESTK